MTINDTPGQSDTTVDTSTCADRLRALADKPEYVQIRGELLHAAAELDGLRETLRNNLDPEELKAFERWIETEMANQTQTTP